MIRPPAKDTLVRFGVSMEAPLAAFLDRWVAAADGRSNRSEAIRGLVRREMSQDRWKAGGSAVAVIGLVYDHHTPELLRKLSHLEHDHSDAILSAQHIHLDHDNCLEVIIARGRPRRLAELADKLRAFKGVKQASLSAIGLERSRR